MRIAIEAVRESGVEVARVEIGRDGKIIVFVGKPEAGIVATNDELDNWMAKHRCELG